MASQANLATEQGQAPSVLGKRPRERLAEHDANIQPKPKKRAPALHPGATKTDQPSKAKPSQAKPRKAKPSLNPGSTGSTGLAVPVDQEVFEKDLEDNEDEDPAKVAAEAEGLQNWFRYCQKHDKLASLDAEERRRRIENCRTRFDFVLDSISKCAGRGRKEEYDVNAKSKLPMNFPWWVFFVHMSPKLVVDRLMASMPEAVRVILGGPLSSDELLMLPSEWNGCTLWTVYTDILRKIISGRDDFTKPEFGRYSGSGIGKDGMTGRLSAYDAMNKGRRLPEIGAHCHMLVRQDIEMNLRIVAVFDRYKTSKPYVLLMELLVSIILRTIHLGSAENIYLRASTMAMIRQATPLDLPEAEFESLNHAAQCLQGLYFRQRKLPKCSNCHTVNTPGWYADEPGLPFSALICNNCYMYRRDHGREERPLYLEERRAEREGINRKALLAQAGRKPAKDATCPGCNRLWTGQWNLPKGTISMESGRTRWECDACYNKVTSQLTLRLARDDARIAFIAAAGPKPDSDCPCPRCKRSDIKIWRVPKTEYGRQYWECEDCARSPFRARQFLIGRVRDDVRIAFIAGAGPKPDSDCPCPRCKRSDIKVWPVPVTEYGRQYWECESCARSPFRAPQFIIEAGRRVRADEHYTQL